MKLRSTLKTLGIAAAAVAFCAFGFTGAKEAEAATFKVIKVSQIQGQKGIQDALDEAKDYATEERPYRIELEDGEYWLDSALHIYSNTYLDAGNAELIPYSNAANDNLLKVGAYSELSTTRYDMASGFEYENITIEGGKWNKNFNGGTTMKAAHAKNFTVKNAELCNTVDGHLMETAAIDGLTVSNCYFHDATESRGDQGGECIQIDILVKGHFNGYFHLDDERDYVSRNISVSNCTFRNVVRAVGAHTGVYGIPFDNVAIINNTLEDVSDHGFILCNTRNLEVSGNTIDCGSNGIKIYNVSDTRNGNYMNVNGSHSYFNPSTDGIIENNTITSKNENGIYLRGIKYVDEGSGEKGGDLIPAGDYCLKNISVKNNTIRTYASGKAPILAVNCNGLDITGNDIKGLSKDYYAIYVKNGSKKVSIKNNTIKGPFEAGIRTFVKEGEDDNPGYGKVQIKTISGNVIKAKGGRNGIAIVNATAKSVTKNRITGCNDYGLRVDPGCSVGLLEKNRITGGKTYAVRVSKGGKIKKYGKNTLTGNEKGDYFISE